MTAGLFHFLNIEAGTQVTTVYAVNGTTGAMEWALILPGSTSAHGASPSISADGRVYLAYRDANNIIVLK